MYNVVTEDNNNNNNNIRGIKIDRVQVEEITKGKKDHLINSSDKLKVDNIIIKVKRREDLFRNSKAIQFGRSNLKTITENMTGCFKMI